MEIFRLFGSIFINSDEATNSMDEIDNRGKKTSLTLSDLGGVAMKLGGVLAAGLAVGSIITGVNDLQKSVNDFQSSTGATNTEMSEFKDTLTSIYNDNFGESFEDISKAMANVKQTTGASGEELKKLTEHALTLRDTFDFDVNESTRTANSLMKQFGISSDQAFTLIAQGAQNGADKNGDLLDTLNEYAPQFKALGFSADQFTNVLIDGAKNGAFSIDKVGDAVKEFNIRSKDMSNTSVDAFKSLGLSADNMSKSFAKGGDTAQKSFDTVIKKLAEIKDPVEQNRIGVELFGTQFEDLQASGILALGNIGSTANSTSGTLQQINSVKYDTFGEALQGIGRNIETGIIVPLSEKVLPKLSEFSGWIISHMPEINASVSEAMGVASSVFDKFAQAIQFVTDNANIFIPVIVGVTAAIVAQSVIETVVGLYKKWQAVTTTQTTLQWLLNAAMNANPIGVVALAIGALIAAGVLLYQNWDTVKEKLGDLWSWMKDIGGKISDYFSGVFDDLSSGFKSFVNHWIDALNSLIGGLNRIHFELPDWLGGKSFGINISQIPHFANGTSFAPGGWSIVGEEGPELVNIPRGSQVLTNSQTEQVLSSDAAPVHIHNHIYLDGKKVAEKVSIHQEKAKKQTGRGLGYA